MPRCYLTGVELKLEDAYVLDVSEAHRAIRELRVKLQAVEKLLQQLGLLERVELTDPKTGKPFQRLDRRLVSSSVANALSVACPGRALFVPFVQWKESRRKRVPASPQQVIVDEAKEAHSTNTSPSRGG